MPEVTLLEILSKVKSYFYPRTKGGATTRDGMTDPHGDALVIDPWMRGGLQKGTDNKLYMPLGASGYQRTKGAVVYPEAPTAQTTNDDVVIGYSYSGPSTLGQYIGMKFLCVYQNSGGPIDFELYADAGKATKVYAQTIQTGVWTVLNISDIQWSSIYICWSAAAGATQKAIYTKMVTGAYPLVT